MAIYKIAFVSLGPGDPELITLKGLKALHASDIIFTPATRSKSGEEFSRSESVVLSLGIDAEKVTRFVVPMSRDRAATIEAYEELAKKAAQLAAGGVKVAITAEGDAGFYSSAQYIEEMLWKRNLETERIAGVPAFVDCARLVKTHIVNQDSSFEVIAKVESAEMLLEKMNEDKSIVLMKVSQWEEFIKDAIRRSTNHIFHYVESCGVEGKEFHTSDTAQILERKFPYFAILLIKRRD
ncbi:MAG: precorrin-2 C(20)-methyltransferase [Rikenellaceae bacterium]